MNYSRHSLNRIIRRGDIIVSNARNNDGKESKVYSLVDNVTLTTVYFNNGLVEAHDILASNIINGLCWFIEDDNRHPLDKPWDLLFKVGQFI